MAPKSRAAKDTLKAKKAAAIATAESKEAEEGAAAKKKPGRPPKPKNKPGPPPPQREPDESDEEEDSKEDDTSDGVVELEWTNTLVWMMVNAVEDNEDIRGGLFPPPGSTKRKGGKPKKNALKFEDDPLYGEAFKKAITAKQQKPWWVKIKNKMKLLVDAARADIEAMGQTGAGLESADDLQPGTQLHTLWDKIEQRSPWFWKIRSFIGERPNLKPVGLGNNSTEMDTSVLLPHIDFDDFTHASSPDDTTDLPDHLTRADTGTSDTDGPGPDDQSQSFLDDDSDDEQVPDRRGKRKAPSAEPSILEPRPKKPKAPKPSISIPAPAAQSAKPLKSTSAKDKFTAVVQAEEATEQERLRLKKEKIRARKELELAKISGQAKVQIEKSKGKTQEKLAKLELARLKLEQEHQLRMAQSHYPQSSHAGPSSMGSSSLFAGNEDSFSFPQLPTFHNNSSDVGSSSASTPFAFNNHTLPGY
ncbi:hypothetical protein B0H19DRAFT_1242891 [Mycena capillaripes]|nr:hypothetical protein B0H19DRAFT_1242891 [Mycena capillaripes]